MDEIINIDYTFFITQTEMESNDCLQDLFNHCPSLHISAVRSDLGASVCCLGSIIPQSKRNYTILGKAFDSSPNVSLKVCCYDTFTLGLAGLLTNMKNPCDYCMVRVENGPMNLDLNADTGLYKCN